MKDSRSRQGKPLIFMRVLALSLRALMWSITALLIALVASCIVELNPGLKRAVYGPDYFASVTIEPEKVTIGVELTNDSPIGKAEYVRRLILVTADGSKIVTNLAYDHGGFSQANLYRTEDEKLVLASSFDSELISVEPLTVTPYKESYLRNRDKGVYGTADLRDHPFEKENRRRSGVLMESNYFDGLFYIGTFTFRFSSSADGRPHRIWSFVQAFEEVEFIRDPGG